MVTKIRRPGKSRLQFETLEQRRMLSGNVQAFVKGDTLHIKGDNLANGVAVVEAAGTFYVIGVPYGTPIAPTTINGVAFASFAAGRIKNIDADLYRGDDLFTMLGGSAAVPPAVVITPPGVTPGPIFLAGKVDVDLGAGDDVAFLFVTSVGKEIDIEAGCGNDLVGLAGVATKELEVHLNTGNDTFVASDNTRVLATLTAEYIATEFAIGNTTLFTALTAQGAITLPAGDIAGVSGELATALDALLPRGAVTFGFQAKEAKINGGCGDDQIVITASATQKKLDIDGEAGHDAVILVGVRSGEKIDIDTQAGNDLVALIGVAAAKDLDVNTGAGNDTFVASLSSPTLQAAFAQYLSLAPAANFGKTILVNGLENNVTIIGIGLVGEEVPTGLIDILLGTLPSGFVSSMAAREIDIDMERGVDYATIEGAVADRVLEVEMGSDNDFLNYLDAQFASGGRVLLDGGAGFDTLFAPLLGLPAAGSPNGTYGNVKVKHFEAVSAVLLPGP